MATPTLGKGVTEQAALIALTITPSDGDRFCGGNGQCPSAAGTTTAAEEPTTVG